MSICWRRGNPPRFENPPSAHPSPVLLQNMHAARESHPHPECPPQPATPPADLVPPPSAPRYIRRRRQTDPCCRRVVPSSQPPNPAHLPETALYRTCPAA